MEDSYKEVRFDKYCETCKHNLIKDAMMHNENAGTYDGTSWSGVYTREEYIPCCYCLEEGAREETEVPVEWEEK